MGSFEPRGPLISHGAAVLGASFSPAGRVLATCGADGTARLWDAEDGSPLGRPLRHGGQVMCLAFSPDGRSLLTGSTDGTARFWDVATGRPLEGLLKHRNYITQVGFRPDGRVVFTGCLDGRVRLWDVPTRRMIDERPRMRSHTADTRPVQIAAFAGTGAGLVTNHSADASSKKGAQLWDGGTGTPIGPVLRHDRDVCAVALSRDGATALTGSEDMTARLWDARTGLPSTSSPTLRHQETVRTVALSPDGRYALTGTDAGVAQLWDASTGQPMGDPMRHFAGWHVSSGEEPQEKSIQRRRMVRALAFHPLCREVVTAGEDGTARVWGVAPRGPAGTPAATEELPAREPKLAHSPDRKWILVGNSDGTARVRDAVSQLEQGRPLKLEHEVLAVAWSVDGRRLLTGGIDGTVRVWSADLREAVGTPMLHREPVRSVAFSPDGRVVLSGGEDGTARLWDAETGKPIGPPMQHDADVTAVAFSPDGRTLLTRTADQVVRRWNTPATPDGPDELFVLWAELVTGSTSDTGQNTLGIEPSA
ncbi:MAG: WD40 repeat domain-containing protein [Isosphaeraceae bacterium]